MLEIRRVTRDGTPAFADVEDDTACEDSMDYTGQPTTPCKRYYLYVPGMTYSVMTKTRSVCETRIRTIGSGKIQKGRTRKTHGKRQRNDDVCQRYDLGGVSMENVPII